MTTRARIAIIAAFVFSLTTIAVSANIAHAKSPIKVLAAKRVAAAKKAYALAQANWMANRDKAEAVYRWSVRWLDAQRDRSARRAKRIAAAKQHLARMNALATGVRQRVSSGLASTAQAAAANYYQVEAALWHARAKRRR